MPEFCPGEYDYDVFPELYDGHIPKPMKKMIPNPQATETEAKADPAKETREQAGIRLAIDRMAKLKKRLKLIGNLGAYPLGPQRTEKLIQTGDQWWNDAKALLRNNNTDQNEFHF